MWIRILVPIVFLFAFTDGKAQALILGLRDNSYVGISYQSKIKNLNMLKLKKDTLQQYSIGGKIEHSIYPESRRYQYVRGYVFYHYETWNFTTSLVPYVGSAYNRSFWNTGCFIYASFPILKRYLFFAVVNPMYDSDLKNMITYSVGGNIRAYKHMYITAQYGNIPEYRENEKRCRIGLVFKEEFLMVSPIISFILPWNARHIRMLVTMSYKIKTKENGK